LKSQWEIDELIEHFILRPEEFALLSGSSAVNQLGLAVLLKFFQYEARFPTSPKEVPDEIIDFLARQLGLDAALFADYKWTTNTIKKHRKTIRHLYEFQRATRQDQRKVQIWLYENVVGYEQNFEKLKEIVYERFRNARRTPPTPEQVEDIINGANTTYERRFYRTTYSKLSPKLRQKLAALLNSPEPSAEGEDKIPFHQIKEDPGEPGVASVKLAAERLEILQQLEMPLGLFDGYTHRFLQKYRKQAGSESISGLKRRLIVESPEVGYGNESLPYPYSTY
jgi:hypothetical protein